MAEPVGGVSPLSAANITHHLAGIDFPANKSKIVDYAKTKGATEPVITELNKLTDREYHSMADVMQEYGIVREKAA